MWGLSSHNNRSIELSDFYSALVPMHLRHELTGWEIDLLVFLNTIHPLCFVDQSHFEPRDWSSVAAAEVNVSVSARRLHFEPPPAEQGFTTAPTMC